MLCCWFAARWPNPGKWPVVSATTSSAAMTARTGPPTVAVRRLTTPLRAGWPWSGRARAAGNHPSAAAGREWPRSARRGSVATPGGGWQHGGVDYVLAQVNVARLRAPLDSPLLADFVADLDPVNATADAAPGFLWRLQTEDGNATSVRAFEWDAAGSAGVLVNMSV